jgi:hypothetical protein
MELNNLREDEINVIINVLSKSGYERLAGKIMNQVNDIRDAESNSALAEYMAHRMTGRSGNLSL